jgi:hypothetical protein
VCNHGVNHGKHFDVDVAVAAVVAVVEVVAVVAVVDMVL